jgi:uncharacterized protein (DUF934 family)
MALIRKRKVVENDSWTLVSDDSEVPPSGDVIVGLARFSEDRAKLLARGDKLGVRIDPTDDVSPLAEHLDALGIVAVNFPKFADGRGYSKARMLRDRHGYKGELRAVGDVLPDQLYLMQRCGIDAFALKDGKDTEKAIACLDHLTVAYQGASDDERPLYRRR